jgi:hypothetical protein
MRIIWDFYRFGKFWVYSEFEFIEDHFYLFEFINFSKVFLKFKGFIDEDEHIFGLIKCLLVFIKYSIKKN